VVAVDGGDSYWHRRAGGEEAGSMVLNELIPMLSTMNLDISRVGFIGWSMGGYGAMLLGARLGPARTAGICAVSPALYQSYTASTLGAFDSYDDWTHNTVFGLPALSSIPLRIDCGNDDRFAPATPPRPPTSSSPSSERRPPVGSRPVDTTKRTGVSSCRASSPGCDPDAID